ncbi:2-deoxyglucose-6-phosphate phosphatase [Moniliophthora roreri MCA 2997]|uniref:2-deoxyglucose-6-phosphate phosphatase n=2 Tax=Moniliophthora roreri TaxID=221103 RepID=V2X2D5_MONRO|nr:2-deoxyglucose-6-phosphate phosphatase [Moniliophthora roreri MCA 2997]KAI3611500.1 2-deoxyglucose-6-phosphate phosphatase [Moniliophthora roreri]
MSSQQTFYVDAVLFDMDGTLTDSISAVEAAWGKVAKDIGQDPAYVIAATHGKRAVDNLAQFKPYIKAHEMDDEVQKFEESILFFADAYNKHGPGSRRGSRANSFSTTPNDSPIDSGSSTPALTPGSSAPSSRASSIIASETRRPSFGARLGSLLRMTAVPEARVVDRYHAEFEDSAMADDHENIIAEEDDGKIKAAIHHLEAWQLEAASVDRSVRILPGVKRMIDSLPAGRYAVATSGAKTYAYGCMTRVGITPPPVTITADDKRLKAGKPAPDPFLLAAKCLGYDAKKCVVFEDSPSGIRAGVASGATVIAVCTSHERSKIENCGAHYIVENMDHVKCDVVDGKLKFTIRA